MVDSKRLASVVSIAQDASTMRSFSQSLLSVFSRNISYVQLSVNAVLLDICRQSRQLPDHRFDFPLVFTPCCAYNAILIINVH